MYQYSSIKLYIPTGMIIQVKHDQNLFKFIKSPKQTLP